METNCMDFIATSNCEWTIKIRKRIVNLNYLRSKEVWNRKTSDPGHNKGRYEIVIPRPNSLEAGLYEIIEENPVMCMEYIIEESEKQSVLLSRMAQFLSPVTIEKICAKVFTAKDIGMDFVLRFYEIFLPAYLRRAYSWSSLSLLIRARKAHPDTFKELVRCVLKDTDIPSAVLQDYVQNVSESSRNDFMRIIVNVELTTEEFVHNLTAIHSAFKGCELDEDIFRTVLNNLATHGDYCRNNIQYGRLLFCFMKNKSAFDVRPTFLYELIEKHCTSYRSQCSAILDDFIAQFFSNINLSSIRRSFNNDSPTDNFRL